MIRVVVVDDQSVIRSGLRSILRADPEIDVVAEASDGVEAFDVCVRLVPDVILMDLRMPRLDGVQATTRLREASTLERARILILTTFDGDENVVLALRAGADGFLGKTAEPDELISAIKGIARGDVALSQSAQQALVHHAASTKPPRPADLDALRRLADLTERERDVVEAVARGLTNDQIAASLFISPYTVKTHLNRAMTKAGANERSQMVILAFRADWVDPSD